MRRRRPIFRRGKPLIDLPRAKAPQVNRMINQANVLFDQGDYSSAANIFQKLAKGAEQRNLFKPAPFFFLKAGEAFFLSKQLPQGEENTRHGLELLATTSRWPAFYHAGHRAVQLLKDQSLFGMANNLYTWLCATLPDDFEPPELETATSNQTTRLPEKCSQCGATIHPNEVEWETDYSVECLYCGSIIQAIS